MPEEANENAEGLEVFSCLLQEPSIWDGVYATYSHHPIQLENTGSL